MINKIQIENLRSIQDSGAIDIKPINILLGANSSGKSTFLRSFPLVTQSVNKRLRGPISWFDTTLVDFGDYKTAKSSFAGPEDCIRFTFHLDGFLYYRRFYFYSDEVYYRNPTKKKQLDQLTFGLDGDAGGTYVKELEFVLGDTVCQLSVESRDSGVEIKINGNKADLPFEVKFENGSNLGILPMLVVTQQTSSNQQRFGSMVKGVIERKMAKLCISRLRNYDRFSSVVNYDGLDKEGFLAKIKEGGNIVSLKRAVKPWNTETPEFLELYELFILSKLDSFISYGNDEIWNFYNNCGYIAPLRAEASRYYRNQELQVNDVDSYGHNLQEFISSLSRAEKKDYDAFIGDVLRVSPQVSSSLGHQSISIRSKNGDFNLADVGSGYAQVLPVLTKIWHSLYLMKNPRKNRYLKPGPQIAVILIEQPELHLHPALQAKIGDVLIKAAIEAGKTEGLLRLIVETHSPAIINRIGRRIKEGQIDPNDVNVVLFEKEPESPSSSVKEISYNEKGQLVDWPWGFLEPND